MSDKKQTFPRRALLVRPTYASGTSFADAFSVVAVDVQSVNGANAVCTVRVGRTTKTETHPVANLASDAEKAAAKLATHFAALFSRPLLQPVAGKTESSAAANSKAA